MKSNICFTYRQSTSGPSLKFRQLKEYINSQRQFFLDRNDISKQNKVIHNKYYLIDENWVKQWKESINFEKFYELFQNRFVTEDDYSLFIEHMPKSRSNNLLLNNSEVYDNKGEIKYLSNFIIVSSKCYDTFNEQRKKTVYDIKVTSPEILFLKDRFILTINSHIKIIYFQTNQSTKDEELIIIFQFGTKANIISEIENPDINIKSWLKEHDIDNFNLINKLQVNRNGCQYILINKNTKNGKLSINSSKNLSVKEPLKNNIIVNKNLDLPTENEIKEVNNLKEIKELKEKLNKANKIIEKQNKDIQDLKAQLNNIKTVYIDNNEINNLRNEINNKNNQINSLKQQLQNIKNNNGKIIQNKDKCVTFISQDSTLFFGVSCSGDSTFAEVEEKLYQEYPEYRETNNTFLAQGKIILRFKTIDQNNIGTGKPVILVRES